MGSSLESASERLQPVRGFAWGGLGMDLFNDPLLPREVNTIRSPTSDWVRSSTCVHDLRLTKVLKALKSKSFFWNQKTRCIASHPVKLVRAA